MMRIERLGSTRLGRAVETAIGMAAAMAGAGLLYLAAPTAVASLAEIPGNATLKRLYREVVDASALGRLIRSREASIGWRKKGRTYTDLALARMVLGEQGGIAKHCEQLALAERALAHGLALSPMHPYGWMRLVQVRMAHECPAGEIAPPLGLALDTGPREDRMIMLVAEAGLRAWSELDDRRREQVAGKVRQAWNRDALGAAALATQAGQTSLLARLVGLRTMGRGNGDGAPQ